VGDNGFVRIHHIDIDYGYILVVVVVVVVVVLAIVDYFDDDELAKAMKMVELVIQQLRVKPYMVELKMCLLWVIHVEQFRASFLFLPVLKLNLPIISQ